MFIPPNIQKCVAFVGYRKGIEEKYGGTGFFASVLDSGYSFSYFVTALHVLRGAQKNATDGKIIIRVNLKAGGSHVTETDAPIWVEHPTDRSVDVAVVGVDIEKELDHLAYPMGSVATAEVIKKEGIGVGDDVFLAGLLRGRPGTTRNVPVIRVGTIASMDEDRINSDDFGEIEAYLIETKSIGGLSGSPVFACLSTDTPQGHDIPSRNRHFYLLGLIHGHLGKPDNFGISVVVPATKIMEVLNAPKCESDRKRIAAELNAKNAAVPD